MAKTTKNTAAAKTKVETKVAKNGSELTERETKILKALKNGGLGRSALKAKAGVASGLSRIVGTVKDTAESDSLIGRKLVTTKDTEEGRVFELTAAGRKAVK